MAKKRKKRTRRQLARELKDQQLQQLITWITIGVVVVIVLVLGYGLMTEFFIKVRKPVVQVDDIKISSQDFQARQRYERTLTQFELLQYQNYLNQTDPNNPDTQSFTQQLQMQVNNLEQQLAPDNAPTFAEDVLNQMVEEELVRQAAQERSLSVNSDEVDLQIEQMLGYDRQAAADAITATETTTNTNLPMTAEQYQETYTNFKSNVLEANDYTESQFRNMVEATVLREKLKESMGEDIDQKVEHIESTIFITGTLESAQQLQVRLNEGGEDPEALIEELQADNSDISSGFALPWLPRGSLANQFGPEIEETAFSTPVGQASDPFPGPGGESYYVIYISGHEDRPLEGQYLTQAIDEKYQTWIDTQIEENVEYFEWQEAIITD